MWAEGSGIISGPQGPRYYKPILPYNGLNAINLKQNLVQWLTRSWFNLVIYIILFNFEYFIV